MRNLKNLTKDIREAQTKALKGHNPNMTVQVNPMKLEQLEGLRQLVGNLLQQAEKEKEDLVATCQFYSDLNKALRIYNEDAEDLCLEDEEPDYEPSFTDDELGKK